jgi:hypothetical protein
MASTAELPKNYAVSSSSPSRVDDRETLSSLPWLLMAALFAAAMLLRHFIPVNLDVSWLLVAGERMLDGERLYVDIVEINPPMSVFAYLPGIALARATGLDAAIVTDGLVLTLAAVSLLAACRILHLSVKLDNVQLGFLAVWAVTVLTILPMNVFAQREHIALLTFLPALAVYSLRSNRETPPIWAIPVAGVGTAMTMAFKPYFAVPAILCVAFAVARSGSWRVLFSPENVIAGGLVAIYAVFCYFHYPEYFTVIYPIVRDIYLSWSMPMSIVFFNPATIICAIAVVLLLWVWRQRSPDSTAFVMMFASLGFAFAFYIQRRGWSYQSYPMVALAMITMGYVLAADAKLRLRDFRLAAMAILAVVFVLGSRWFSAGVPVGPIEAAVAGIKPNPRILVMSGEAAIGHPLVRTVHGVWVSRQECLCIRTFARVVHERTTVNADLEARLNGHIALERQWLIEDFKRLPPDVVLIDTLRDGWGERAKADAELAQLLKPYVFVQTIEGIDILRRVD